MTDIQITLCSKLEALRNFSGSLPSQYHYRCPSDFVLREGQFFKPRILSKKIERGAPNECFSNAFQTSIIRELRYVEGYALDGLRGSLPHLRAWNLDDEGFIVEPTWKKVGGAYFGVIFPLSLVYRTQECSVIDDWPKRWPLLQKSWAETQAELFSRL